MITVKERLEELVREFRVYGKKDWAQRLQDCIEALEKGSLRTDLCDPGGVEQSAQAAWNYDQRLKKRSPEREDQS